MFLHFFISVIQLIKHKNCDMRGEKERAEEGWKEISKEAQGIRRLIGAIVLYERKLFINVLKQ